MSELTPLGGWLHQVEQFIRRFVVLSDEQAAAVALWIAHGHGFSSAVATPYLAITSAEKRSGKTLLLEVLSLVSAKPWLTGGTTKAALVRKVHQDAPTLLLDESDVSFNGDKEYAEALRGVLNTGYRARGIHTTCVGAGSNISVQDFSTFCPKAFAGIGKLPDTVEDRSIPIRLKRRARSEQVERFRERKARAAGEALAGGLAMSLDPLLEDLAKAEPELPEELDDRARDVWEPLLAIAEAAGGDWPRRARDAAVRLSANREPDDDTLGVRLLADCRTAFEEKDTDRLPTAELLNALRALDEAPWADLYGKPLSPLRMARLLRRYEIQSRSIWLSGKTAKGYLREQFEDAWERYLSHDPGSKAAGRQDGLDKPETPDFKTAGEPPPAVSENAQKPLEQAILPDLPSRKGDSEPSIFAGIDPDPLVPPPPPEEEVWDYRRAAG